METDYGGQAAYGGQAWQSGQPESPADGQQGLGARHGYIVGSAAPGGRRRRGRTRRGHTAAVTVLLLGVVGLGVSLAGVATQILPRQFTPRQQRQITDWQVSSRWRETPAGTIFPASVYYPAPTTLGGNLTLTARRIGIAGQASCEAATDAAAAAVLDRNGCQAVLRATYADGTDSYVVTVGVAAFAGSAQASTAYEELADTKPAVRGGAGRVAPGVLPVAFTGTPAQWFTKGRRQVSANESARTYVVLYAIGYADDRPWQPVESDSYAYSEMTTFGAGVAQAVTFVLAKAPTPPHCPGTPGC